MKAFFSFVGRGPSGIRFGNEIFDIPKLPETLQDVQSIERMVQIKMKGEFVEKPILLGWEVIDNVSDSGSAAAVPGAGRDLMDADPDSGTGRAGVEEAPGDSQ